MKCLKSRKDEIKQALLEEIVDISSAQLQDFDWQLKVRIYLWACMFFISFFEMKYSFSYYAFKICYFKNTLSKIAFLYLVQYKDPYNM